jgi:tetratricopeptide (TPR) repeat protein
VPTVQYHLAMAYKDLGQTELALATLKKAVALQNDFPERDNANAVIAELTPAAPSGPTPR